MAVPTDEAAFRLYLLQLLEDPEFSEAIHKRSDVDFGLNSQHHTIGVQHTQAKGGDQ